MYECKVATCDLYSVQQLQLPEVHRPSIDDKHATLQII